MTDFYIYFSLTTSQIQINRWRPIYRAVNVTASGRHLAEEESICSHQNGSSNICMFQKHRSASWSKHSSTLWAQEAILWHRLFYGNFASILCSYKPEEECLKLPEFPHELLSHLKVVLQMHLPPLLQATDRNINTNRSARLKETRTS